MLILSRKTDESIDIGDDIQISVLEIKGSRVKLAIRAPRSISIRRSELPPIRREITAADPSPGLSATIAAGLSTFVMETA